MTESHRAMARLHDSSETLKKSLSLNSSASVELDGLFEGLDMRSTLKPLRLPLTLTRTSDPYSDPGWNSDPDPDPALTSDHDPDANPDPALTSDPNSDPNSDPDPDLIANK